MSHQQDNDASTQVFNLEEGNNGKDSGTPRAANQVLDKFQRYLNSARLWIHKRWYEIFFWMCVIALWLDPLFCYSFVNNDDKKCLRVDKKLGTIAIVLRSVMDFLYVIHVISEFCTGVSLPQASGTGRVVEVKADWAITKRFVINILAVLPLPQVVLLIIIAQVTDTGFINATKSLFLVLLFQYVPRVLRISPLFTTFTRTPGTLIGSAWAKASFNLFLYMLASHVVGAFWYLFAVERKIMCWEQACKNRIGCVRLSCDDILGDYTFLTDSCPIKTPNATIFNFGIFLEALDSGIVDSTDFVPKLSYSFWFGLQSLSSLGQSLKTSTYFWEIFFAVIISIFGLVLFAFLIGNMQTYLLSKTAKLEEMRLKGQEIDLWMAFHLLPRDLKDRIKKYQQYKYQETRGVDVENLLHNLPRDIRRDTKRYLCLDVLKKVPMLQNTDIRLLDAICDHLKIMFYIERSYVVREGDPLDEMLLITRGTLLTYTSNGGRSSRKFTGCLEKGDFYGEELLKWALNSPSLDDIPFSTKTVQAHTKVEAFALMANDLKNVVSKFWWHFSKELFRSPSFDLEQWKRRAASAVQAAWRRYYRRKKKKLESLGTTYASRFAANTISTLQHTQEARLVELPPKLPQRPVEHDTTAEQQ